MFKLMQLLSLVLALFSSNPMHAWADGGRPETILIIETSYYDGNGLGKMRTERLSALNEGHPKVLLEQKIYINDTDELREHEIFRAGKPAAAIRPDGTYYVDGKEFAADSPVAHFAAEVSKSRWSMASLTTALRKNVRALSKSDYDGPYSGFDAPVKTVEPPTDSPAPTPRYARGGQNPVR